MIPPVLEAPGGGAPGPSLAGADVLLSFDAFEHIDEPRAFLRCQLLAHRPSRPNRRVSGRVSGAG